MTDKERLTILLIHAKEELKLYQENLEADKDTQVEGQNLLSLICNIEYELDTQREA